MNSTPNATVAVPTEKADAAFWRERAERAELQLAAVSMAAHGGLTGTDALLPTAYGYTTTLADVLRLRAAFDRLALMVGEEQVHPADLVDAQCEAVAA